MQLLQQILFIVLAAVAIWLFVKKAKFISRNIRLGRDEKLEPHPHRWRNMLLMAFGQKRMFDKPLVGHYQYRDPGDHSGWYPGYPPPLRSHVGGLLHFRDQFL
jgi:hypothetical protein